LSAASCGDAMSTPAAHAGATVALADFNENVKDGA
jgi:hypothetical protein